MHNFQPFIYITIEMNRGSRFIKLYHWLQCVKIQKHSISIDYSPILINFTFTLVILCGRLLFNSKCMWWYCFVYFPYCWCIGFLSRSIKNHSYFHIKYHFHAFLTDAFIRFSNFIFSCKLIFRLFQQQVFRSRFQCNLKEFEIMENHIMNCDLWLVTRIRENS